jgi:hypothetical protein
VLGLPDLEQPRVSQQIAGPRKQASRANPNVLARWTNGKVAASRRADFDRLERGVGAGGLVAHVTFIHGISNQPEPATLLEHWRIALLDDDGIDLAALGVSLSMVYWADVLYPRSVAAGAAQESNGLELEQGIDREATHLTWLLAAPPEQQTFVRRLAHDVGLENLDPCPGDQLDRIDPDSPLEAVPLPAPLKRRLMRVFLRNVHHYLFNATFSPRQGETYQVRDEVLSRTVNVLREGANNPGPHIILCHSLGAVIGYDVLTNAIQIPAVDALIMVGSPLGLSEVQAGLTPPWTAADGWPDARLGDRYWANVYDRLDPVCGFDPRIANDYRWRGAERVNDIEVFNSGSWRHSIAKYLGQPALRTALQLALR